MSLGVTFIGLLVLDLIAFFLSLYQLMNISDLESDYINPIDGCKTLNQLVMPELILTGVFLVISLFTGSFLAIFLVLPLAGYNFYKLFTKQHKYDPTRVFHKVVQYRTEYMIKMFGFILGVFVYLYLAISAFVAGTVQN